MEVTADKSYASAGFARYIDARRTDESNLIAQQLYRPALVTRAFSLNRALGQQRSTLRLQCDRATLRPIRHDR